MARYPDDEETECFLIVDGTMVPEATWRAFDLWYGDKSYRHVDFVLEMFYAALEDIKSQMKEQGLQSPWDIPIPKGYR